jgi:hypothetical protein
MKNLYIYFIIILVLILLLITANYNSSSQRIDKRDFAVEDTLLVNKIILENRNLEKLKLSRGEKNWILNDTIIANQYLINLLLKTIKEMQIKNPIARAALPNIIKRMATQNTKLDIYKKNKKIKTIYIAGETPDQLGTYMMIEGAKEPYVVHIPGFNGYLSSRFSCKENIWKSKRIFNKLIKKTTIKLNDNKSIHLSQSNILKLNKIYCESFLTSNKNFNVEVIKNRTPFITMIIENKDGTTEQLNCIRKKPVNKDKYNHHKYDRERFYAFKNNTLMLVQYKQFNYLMNSDSLNENVFFQNA